MDKIILGIESSCDETACSIVKNGRIVISNIISSQIDIHRKFGGVVPEIASRNHTLAIENVAREALTEASMTMDDIDAIGVTYGPGLLGALLVGVSFAKGLAYRYKKPLYAVSHIHGHMAANYIDSTLEPPYLCLLVSGGHTAILEVSEYNNHKVLCESRDDAIGEAYDKVARVLGLKYPGGPEIQATAENVLSSIKMPKIKVDKNNPYFSYSGLKTFVINYVNKLTQKNREIPKSDIAASFQDAANQQLKEMLDIAIKKTGIKTIAVAGGVAANIDLRKKIDEYRKLGINVYYPKPIYCTDNAAMIASATYYYIQNKVQSVLLDLDACANIDLNWEK